VRDRRRQGPQCSTEQEDYDGRGEPNSDITFSAPTFIFLLKFLLPCLSVSSDCFAIRTVASALAPAAISDADWDKEGIGSDTSSLMDVSDESGEPKDARDKPDDLDLSDGGGIETIGPVDRLVLLGDGVKNPAGLVFPLELDGDDSRFRFGVALGENETGGDLGRRNLLVLFLRLRPGVRPRRLPSEGDGEAVPFGTGVR